MNIYRDKGCRRHRGYRRYRRHRGYREIQGYMIHRGYRGYRRHRGYKGHRGYRGYRRHRRYKGHRGYRDTKTGVCTDQGLHKKIQPKKTIKSILKNPPVSGLFFVLLRFFKNFSNYCHL